MGVQYAEFPLNQLQMSQMRWMGRHFLSFLPVHLDNALWGFSHFSLDAREWIWQVLICIIFFKFPQFPTTNFSIRHTSLPNNLKPAKKLSLMGFHLQLKSQLCVVFLMSKKSLKFKAPHSTRDVFGTIYINGAVLNGDLLVPWCFSIKLIWAAKPGVKCDHKAGHWDKMRRNRLSDLGNAPPQVDRPLGGNTGQCSTAITSSPRGQFLFK